MDCNEARDLLDAYADNMLGLADTARLNRHLQGCAACRAELDGIRALGHALRAQAPRHPAPAALRARISAALPAAPAPAAQRPAPPAATGPAVGWGAPAWGLAAMALVTAGALVLAAVLWLQRPGPEAALEPQIVASHVRALLSGRSIDVASTDQHTVKPWFNGRLDYAPPVIDLAAQGFPLAGGRVDYMAGRRVAVLSYRAGKHPIDLYVIPAVSASAAPVQTRSDDGYALASWADDGLRYWAITDAEPAVLQRYVQSLRAAPR